MALYLRPNLIVGRARFLTGPDGALVRSGGGAGGARVFGIGLGCPPADGPVWLAEYRRRLALPVSPGAALLGCAGVVMLCGAGLIGLFWLGLPLCALLLAAAAVVSRADALRRTTGVLYTLDDSARAAYEQLLAAFAELRRSSLVQAVQGRSATANAKYHGGATSLISSSAASPRLALPPLFQGNLEVPVLVAGAGQEVYLLPDCLLIVARQTAAAVPYGRLRVELGSTTMVVEVAPHDAKVVGHTWRYVNKKGGPDKRFANNPQLPLVELSELSLGGSEVFTFQVSRTTAAAALHEAVVGLGRLAGDAPPVKRAVVAEPTVPPAPVRRAPVPREAPDDARWVPPGKGIVIAGRTIPGGMFYVGNRLASIDGCARTAEVGDYEPALIGLSLPVSRRADASSACPQGTYAFRSTPSYAELTPNQRATYLDWLAGGRRDRAAHAAYVRLFLAGLERRVLHDSAEQEEARDEWPAITAELQKLIRRYGERDGFGAQARALLDLIEALRAIRGEMPEAAPPTLPTWSAGPGLTLKATLATLVAAGRPVPWDWALAWWLADPARTSAERTPAQRCWSELRALFAARFRQAHGEGWVVKPNRGSLSLVYQPLSSSFGAPVRLDYPGLPDVTRQKAALRPVGELFEACQNDLDAYSRWLGRHGENRDDPQAIALLPEELVRRHQGGRVALLRDRLRQWVGGNVLAVVPGAEVIDTWLTTPAASLSKKDHLGLAQLLGKLGFGLVPDPRFRDPVLASGSATVVFRLSADRPETASTEYEGLALLLRLFVAVATADGQVTPEAQSRLSEFAARQPSLTEGEQVRLRAYSRWLVATRPGLHGLRARLAGLADEQRHTLGLFLVSVAGVDGVITPGEVSALTRVYQALGLDELALHRHLHELSAPSEPVRVRPADPPTPGHALPAAKPAREPALGDVHLDMASVAAKLAESSRVAALLGEIFDDEPEPAAMPSAAPVASDVPGLDEAHAQLLRQAAGHERVPRETFGAWCDALGLLPDGALDRLNEAALDALDEPLWEPDGDDLLFIPETIEELLSC